MSIMDAAMAFLLSLQGIEAYALLLALLVASGFGLPINEDILLIGAAALTLKGVMAPLPLVAVAWLGIVTADALVFHWGRRFGGGLLEHRWMARLISSARLASMQTLLLRYGPGYLFAARFMPGLRTALFFAGGSLKLPYRQLFIYDGAAAAIELPLLVYAVRYVGGRWQDIIAHIRDFQSILVPTVLLVALAVWLVLRARARTGKAAPTKP
jgi:membrane protein DedA with SNARE-associated domain